MFMPVFYAFKSTKSNEFGCKTSAKNHVLFKRGVKTETSKASLAIYLVVEQILNQLQYHATTKFGFSYKC